MDPYATPYGASSDEPRPFSERETSATIPDGPEHFTSDFSQPADGELDEYYENYVVQDLKTMKFPALDPNYQEQEQQNYAHQHTGRYSHSQNVHYSLTPHEPSAAIPANALQRSAGAQDSKQKGKRASVPADALDQPHTSRAAKKQRSQRVPEPSLQVHNSKEAAHANGRGRSRSQRPRGAQDEGAPPAEPAHPQARARVVSHVDWAPARAEQPQMRTYAPDVRARTSGSVPARSSAPQCAPSVQRARSVLRPRTPQPQSQPPRAPVSAVPSPPPPAQGRLAFTLEEELTPSSASADADEFGQVLASNERRGRFSSRMPDSERELSFAEPDDHQIIQLTKEDLKYFGRQIGERAAVTVLEALKGHLSADDESQAEEGSPVSDADRKRTLKKSRVRTSRKRKQKVEDLKICAEPRTQAQSDARSAALVSFLPCILLFTGILIRSVRI